jgi:hypothetical protein
VKKNEKRKKSPRFGAAGSTTLGSPGGSSASGLLYFKLLKRSFILLKLIKFVGKLHPLINVR